MCLVFAAGNGAYCSVFNKISKDHSENTQKAPKIDQ